MQKIRRRFTIAILGWLCFFSVSCQSEKGDQVRDVQFVKQLYTISYVNRSPSFDRKSGISELKGSGGYADKFMQEVEADLKSGNLIMNNSPDEGGKLIIWKRPAWTIICEDGGRVYLK